MAEALLIQQFDTFEEALGRGVICRLKEGCKNPMYCETKRVCSPGFTDGQYTGEDMAPTAPQVIALGAKPVAVVCKMPDGLR
jgi:hypothetical protein